ncbi:MAG: DUF4062 domain-containing protein [Deltaproteobacteria bacterium]|nr:DUF4062 domain-containing protein [Deltaproteobacteria bacterium]
MKPIRIFLSSVQKELAAERADLRAYLHSDPLLRRFFEMFLFEDLPAADRRTDAVYLDEVAACELYVGIFGNEYGAEDAAGVSPTEREFNRATELGKPRLIYVKGTGDKSRHPKMLALIRRAGSELIRRRFIDSASLLPAVYASLVAYLDEHKLILNGPFDAAPCRGATIRDIGSAGMKMFIRDARASRGFPLRESASGKELLTHLNLLDDGQPTNAAVLLFGKEPQRFLPASEIKCAHFHGTEVAKPIPSYQVYKGTAFSLVDQAVDFVMSKLALRVGTRAKSAQAPVTYEIPREVVAEGIVNAVAHRDYTSNGSVQVMLFADRLEVWNPGRLPSSLTLQRLREPHGSVPHNPLLAEPLYLTKYIERMGTGTGDMIRRCRDAGLPEPEFRMTDGFALTIPRLSATEPDGSWETLESSGETAKSSGETAKSSGETPESSGETPESSGETGEKIVELMRENPEITIPEIAGLMGKTTRAIEKQVQRLKSDGAIARIGPTKGGHWEVSK